MQMFKDGNKEQWLLDGASCLISDYSVNETTCRHPEYGCRAEKLYLEQGGVRHAVGVKETPAVFIRKSDSLSIVKFLGVPGKIDGSIQSPDLQFTSDSRSSFSWVVNFNPIKMVKGCLVEKGLYGDDTEASWDGNDNFLDPTKLINIDIPAVRRIMLTLTCELLNELRLQFADDMHHLGIPVSSPVVSFNYSEMAWDVRVNSAEETLRELEIPFISNTYRKPSDQPKEYLSGWVTSARRVIVYAKTPSILRYEAKLPKKVFQSVCGSCGVPSDVIALERMLNKVADTFYPYIQTMEACIYE